MYDITVIIPTFKEEANIEKMIGTINRVCRAEGIAAEILVVDDNSPDGTIAIVRSLQSRMPNLSLIIRTENPGLSQSLYEGMKHAKADIIQCIDCDFSHPPERIPDFYPLIKDQGYDMVIGSRYIREGRVLNWSLTRRVLSFGAALLGRVLIPHVHDSGSGFFAFRKSVIENVSLKPRGFRMGFEILGKGNWVRVREIPICFKDRIEGQSKMRFAIVIDYLKQWINIVSYNGSAEKSPSNIILSWKFFLHLSA
ncbi:MAG: polyprenol monophosphomannose synthase [Methanoregulaceae archaeon]